MYLLFNAGKELLRMVVCFCFLNKKRGFQHRIYYSMGCVQMTSFSPKIYLCMKMSPLLKSGKYKVDLDQHLKKLYLKSLKSKLLFSNIKSDLFTDQKALRIFNIFCYHYKICVITLSSSK